MRSKGTRTIKPVDEDHQIHDHPARAGLEAIMDQKLFHQRIKSERASAYWFAASLWGVTGLILGAFLGVYITLAVQQGSGATTSSPARPPTRHRTASTAVRHCCRAKSRRRNSPNLPI
jgi:hypothetical protein